MTTTSTSAFQDSKNRILLLTNSEHGQAQTQLALAYELLSRPDIEVHLASFPALAPRTVEVSKLHGASNRDAAKSANPGKSIVFHPIEHPAWLDAYGDVQKLAFPPGLFGAMKSYLAIDGLVW